MRYAICILAVLLASAPGCIIVDDACVDITCGAYGYCDVILGDAVCICDTGYHAEGYDCVPDYDGADIQFTWAFHVGASDTTSCTLANVYDVRVLIKDAGVTEFDETIDCDLGGGQIDNWALGRYDLLLQGLCDDLSVGYEFDVYMDITQAGLNDYGELVLEPIGYGCP